MSKVSFRHLSFQNIGPFRGNYELDLSPGLNLVAGANGSGKSTLLNVFKATLGLPFPKGEVESFSAQRQERPLKNGAATFTAEMDGTVPEDNRWKSLVALDFESITDKEYLGILFETAVEKGDDELCFNFNNYVVPAFHKRNLSVDDKIQCHLFRNGRLSFSVNNSFDDRLTQNLWTDAAMGERTMTAYGLFISLRKVSCHNGPLFLDSPFCVLDSMFKDALAKAVLALPWQVIVVDSPHSMASLFPGYPGYLLSYAEAEGRSRITPVKDMISVEGRIDGM